jgi:radical SAM superfamily enzyme YgiQ (UPF0313 family)
MNVLLISPNTLIEPYPVYPIGLDYVAGSIAEHHQVKIVDMLQTSREELAILLEQFSPDVIGISCRNIDNTDCSDSAYFLEDHRDLIGWLRSHNRQATIVLGGSGFTIMPEKVLSLLDADYGIIGEGERFGAFLDAIATHSDPLNVSGVISKQHTATRPPPWEGQLLRRFDYNSHLHDYYLQHGGMLNLQTKRGCSFRCVYCPYPRIEGKVHRLADPLQVAIMARGLEEAGAKYLFFTDSAFNSDVQHSLAVAAALQKEHLSIPWGAFFAPIALPEHYFAAMAEAGCKHVEFGTEALSDTMLAAYRKPFQTKDVFLAHEKARAAGLHIAHYLLLGGPGESRQTLEESLNNVEKLPKAVFFFFTGVRIYPGTELYDIALSENKIYRTTDMLRPIFYPPDAILLEEIEQIVRAKAAGRSNWVVGSGDELTVMITKKMYARGFAGPLWEFLAR